MHKRLIPLTLLAGVTAGLLRAFEWRLAWDSSLWLMKHYHISSLLLIAFSVTVVSLLFLLLRSTPDSAFSPDFLWSKKLVWIEMPAVLLLWASAILDIGKFIGAQKPDMPISEISTLIFALLSVFTGISVIILSKTSAAGPPPREYGIYMLAPVFWACFWLLKNISSYAVNPEPLSFLYDMLGSIFTLLALYSSASFFYFRTRGRRTVFYCAMSVFFSLIVLLGTGLHLALWGTLPMSGTGWSDVCRSLFSILHLVTLMRFCASSPVE